VVSPTLWEGENWKGGEDDSGGLVVRCKEWVVIARR
jgi:hypothetical protein